MVAHDLLGEGAPLAEDTASIIGMPRTAPGGFAWYFSRAELPISLASELSTGTGTHPQQTNSAQSA